jgi:hypothetical protein
MLPALSPAQWALAMLAALCIGISKSGFTGLGLATVVIMAQLFPPRQSTGILLPLLICGDIGSVIAFRQHADWRQIRRMLPPAMAGVIAGFFLMSYIPDRKFGPTIGWLVLGMTVLQLWRRLRPEAFQTVPHTRPFAWSMGGLAGVVTMIANGAGPIMVLYFLAVDLPKLVLVGTGAWYFLIMNLFKVPFSAALGLIHGSSLLFNLVLVPFVVIGTLSGRRLVLVVSQRLFETLLLIFTTVASLQMIGVFRVF